jgi:hypothetical protein
MIVPGSSNPLLLASGAGYQIANSLRFRASNSAYLSRTFGVPTDSKKFTLSWWMKRGTVGSAVSILSGINVSSTFSMQFSAQTTNSDGDYLRVANPNAGTTYLYTDAVFRDPSAWYHFVFVFDSANATANDRAILYCNGTRLSATVSVTLNATSRWNENGANARIGLGGAGFATVKDYFDGHKANFYMIDGQALTPASFGQADATTGVWVPKAYSGTYGTNGFFLQFKDATSTTTIGYDTSGNSNNFTTSGISVTSGVTFDQMTDTPTLNYCTFSSIDQVGGTNTLTAGLDITTSAGAISAALGTIYVSTGKWYWEFTANGVAGITQVGVAKAPVGTISTNGPGQSANAYVYLSNGTKGNNNSFPAYGATYTTNDVIGAGLDMDAGTLTFYKNNTSQGQAYSGLTGDFAAIVGDTGAAATISGSINFGQRAFSYTPPSGFKALNTANLSVPVIKKPSLYMDATLRTGTGATASVSLLGFQPDLVWIKSRSAATNHNMFDSGRGVQKGLGTNWSGAEYTDANTLTAFNSNGYSLGSDASSRGVNINTNTYVDWAWKKGATPGFDVVTFTGNATNRTISHGLGVVPEMMMVRTRGAPTGFEPFVTYHSKLNGGTNPANYYLYSTQTAAEAASATFFNNTMPTASVFTVGTDSFVNQSGTGIVAYLFAGVEGFSKFGSYVGNGAADGPFVWCGFRPSFVMIKRRDSAENWSIQDDARNPFNVVNARLKPNSADAEGIGSAQNVDFLANGFKLRNTDPEKNASGGTYIFAAFAEAPFKYARAR